MLELVIIFIFFFILEYIVQTEYKENELLLSEKQFYSSHSSKSVPAETDTGE